MGPSAASARDQLLLQLIVLVWGATSVLGRTITLPVQTMVIWRTGIAALILGLWVLMRRGSHGAALWRQRALWNGCLIGFHWYLFFLAGRLGNVSVALTGAATCALWISLLEPLVIRQRRWHLRECLLALAVTGGVALVAWSDRVPLACLFTGIAAAAVAALFSIFNARIVQHLPAAVMSYYEMVSATLFCAVLSLVTLQPFDAGQWIPAAADWLPLLSLAVLCTVFAFSLCVWLQRRVSPFSIGIAANLEPVYGMILAALVFGSSEVMGPRFYAGAAVIIGCVIFHGLAGRRPAKSGSGNG